MAARPRARGTGLPFDTTGDVEVPGALVPVRCEAERGYGVYVEPNVWIPMCGCGTLL